jgi:hypothetical protein
MVVENLIQKRAPMVIHHDVVKVEVKHLKTQVKTDMAMVGNFESKVGRQATDIAKLQQEMNMALQK